MTRADQRPHQLVRALTVSAWAVIAIGVVLAPFAAASLDQLLLAVMSSYFLLQLLALLVSAHRVPRRRGALLALVGGMLLWAGGSAVLTSAELVEVQSFPTPGEGLFAASYLGLAAYLLLDVPRGRQQRSGTVWLDAVVICGGVACVAVAVLVGPLSSALGESGLPLLLAVLYPLLDLTLAAIVLGQVLVGDREAGLRTVLPALGFVLLAVADSSFLVVRGSGYADSPWLDAMWGTSFALVGTGAVLRRRRTEKAAADRPTWVLVAAALAAVAVLVLRPGADMNLYVVVPAVVTLGAAGCRMAVALRQARRTAEAVALSLTDELTGLGNRRSVLADLAERLAEPAPLALFLLDLDGFKEINDSLGHSAGDSVLEAVARRLTDVVDPRVTISRLGGDEFALLVPDDDHLELLELARDVREVLLTPLAVDNLHLAIRSSVGIAVADDGNRTSGDLLRQADVAMYEAKESSTGAVVYDATRDGFTRQRLRLGEELREAIAEGQLELWYQPQLDARTRAVVAVEALVRWVHPEHGLLQPAGFLPGARRSGLMPALSEVVVRQAVADLSRWRAEGFDFRVAVNLAPPELLAGPVLPMLYDVLADAHLEPGALTVEVTEDSFLSDPQRARRTMLELRDHDVDISIDDYGTGFSSLSYLRDLPVHEMKMDRSFVSTICSDHRSRVIVESSTQMGHAMGMRVVAEGVEDAATAEVLCAMGVDLLQGYHFCRPMPGREVSGWVGARSQPIPVPVPRRSAPRIVR